MNSYHDILVSTLEQAIGRAQKAGTLPPFAPLPIDLVSGKSYKRSDGSSARADLTSAVCFKIAALTHCPPAAVANSVAGILLQDASEIFSSIEVARSGLLNLTLSRSFLAQCLDEARSAGADFGRSYARRPDRINLEFVSANPTGPLHVGNARGGFAGDVLARVLGMVGHQVVREYYVNDAGSQIRNLGLSVLAVRRKRQLPLDGYRGAYVRALAAQMPEQIQMALRGAADPARLVGSWAARELRTQIEASLARAGITFDVWTSEQALREAGWVEQALAELRRSEAKPLAELETAGALFEQDKAIFFRSSAYGDDKDRALVRSDGEPTYFGSDAGYLLEKRSRGFERFLYLWGADHHGTVARLKGAAQALGLDPDRVNVLLLAWVRLLRAGVPVAMSKRSGNFISLDELIAEIGVDAAHWFFAARSLSAGIDLDLDLARSQSRENPVYYVQYAHARICTVLERAAKAGLYPAAALDPTALDEPAATLAQVVLRLPEVVEDAAVQLEVQGLCAYATELATAFHAYYTERRIALGVAADLAPARLALADGTRIALANTLALLGISAPSAMAHLEP
jgi:arginyl-tRNA synthetase